MEALLQHGFGRQLGEVFGDAEAALLEFEEFDPLGGLAGAEDQADGRLLAGLALVVVQPAQVKVVWPKSAGWKAPSLSSTSTSRLSRR